MCLCVKKKKKHIKTYLFFNLKLYVLCAYVLKKKKKHIKTYVFYVLKKII
jgi:hypothetical protein